MVDMKLVQLSYRNEENVKVVENVNAETQRFIDLIAGKVEDIRPCEPDEKEGLVGLVVEKTYMDDHRKTELLSVVISNVEGKLKFDLPATVIRGIRLKTYEDKHYGQLLGIDLDLNRYRLNNKQKSNRLLNAIKLVSGFNQQLISACAVLNGEDGVTDKSNDETVNEGAHEEGTSDKSETTATDSTTPDYTGNDSEDADQGEKSDYGNGDGNSDLPKDDGKEINFMP